MSVSFRSVSIISVKKAFDWGERPASQSEHLCRTNANLSDKGTARYPLTRVRIRGGESLTEVSKILRYGFRGRVGSLCNITTVSGQKKALGIKAGLQIIYCSNNSYFIILFIEPI